MLFPFTNNETEAHRDHGVWLTTHIYEVAELWCEAGLSDPPDYGFLTIEHYLKNAIMFCSVLERKSLIFITESKSNYSYFLEMRQSLGQVIDLPETTRPFRRSPLTLNPTFLKIQ